MRAVQREKNRRRCERKRKNRVREGDERGEGLGAGHGGSGRCRVYQTCLALSDHAPFTRLQHDGPRLPVWPVTYDEAIEWLREQQGALHLAKTAAGCVISAKVGTAVARRMTAEPRLEPELRRLQLEVIDELKTRLAKGSPKHDWITSSLPDRCWPSRAS